MAGLLTHDGESLTDKLLERLKNLLDASQVNRTGGWTSNAELTPAAACRGWWGRGD